MFSFLAFVTADDATKDDKPTVDEDIGKSREASRTDDEAVQRWVNGKNTSLRGN